MSFLEGVFGSRTRDEWMKSFSDLKCEFGYAPILTLNETVKDQQAYLNDYIIDYDHPSRGRIRYVGFPVQLSKTPLSVKSPAPELGQHTEEVLLEIGYTWDDINAMREAGSI